MPKVDDISAAFNWWVKNYNELPERLAQAGIDPLRYYIALNILHKNAAILFGEPAAQQAWRGFSKRHKRCLIIDTIPRADT
jgi:hypothetical protein